MLSAIGDRTIRFLHYVGGVSRQTKNGLYWTFLAPFRGNRLRWQASVHQIDRKSTRLNSSHIQKSRMPSSA